MSEALTRHPQSTSRVSYGHHLACPAPASAPAQILNKLGIRAAFGQADFSKASSDPLVLTNVLHSVRTNMWGCCALPCVCTINTYRIRTAVHWCIAGCRRVMQQLRMGNMQGLLPKASIAALRKLLLGPPLVELSSSDYPPPPHPLACTFSSAGGWIRC